MAKRNSLFIILGSLAGIAALGGLVYFVFSRSIRL